MTPRQLIGSLASAVVICLIAAAPASVRARAEQTVTSPATAAPLVQTGGECAPGRDNAGVDA